MFTNAKLVTTNANVDNYHAQDAKPGEEAFVMSPGALRDFSSCPARWVAGYRRPEGPSSKFRGIFLTHALAPDRFARTYALRPDTYQARVLKCPECGSESDAKQCRKCGLSRVSQVVEKPWSGAADYCRKWTEQAEQREQKIIRQEDNAAARGALARLSLDPAIKQYREDSDVLAWFAAEWKDADTGLVIPCRALISFLPRDGTPNDNSIAAVKITRDASHTPWRRQAYYGLYHVQAAWTLDIFAAATGAPRSLFYFVVVETMDPWEPARRQLTPTFIQLGRRTYERALKAYATCLATRTWPSYDLATTGPDAWTPVETEPWMHQGDGTSAGFTPQIALAAPKSDEGGELSPAE